MPYLCQVKRRQGFVSKLACLEMMDGEMYASVMKVSL